MESRFPTFSSTPELFEEARAAYHVRFGKEAPVKIYNDDNYFALVSALELNEPLPDNAADENQADD